MVFQVAWIVPVAHGVAERRVLGLRWRASVCSGTLRGCLCETVHSSNSGHKLVHELSGGMKQCAAGDGPGPCC